MGTTEIKKRFFVNRKYDFMKDRILMGWYKYEEINKNQKIKTKREAHIFYVI